MDLFKSFVEALGKTLSWETSTVETIVFILLGLGTLSLLFQPINKGIKWLISKRNQRLVNTNLYPYFTWADVKQATHFYMPTRFQNVNPNEDDEPGATYIATVKEQLLPMFIKQVFQRNNEHGRYFLLLADSGMGKTTFLINLYLKYSNKIELPFCSPKFNIVLLPLADSEILDQISKVENAKETILLLDALDEDPHAIDDYKARLAEILSVCRDFRFVVITCRTQFFPSAIDEPSHSGRHSYGESGEYKFKKLYLSPFSDQDVEHYIRKRFSAIEFRKKKRARDIIKTIPKLAVRPMLLSQIDALVELKDEIHTTSQAYKILIDFWIQRESNKAGIVQKFGSNEEYKKLLLKFTEEFAYYLYNNKENIPNLSVPKGQILEWFTDTDSIKVLESLEFLSNIEVRSKSLLSRDALGHYKFSHRSIFEYFLAQLLLGNPQGLSPLPERSFEMVFQFYAECWGETDIAHLFRTGWRIDGGILICPGSNGSLQKFESLNSGNILRKIQTIHSVMIDADQISLWEDVLGSLVLFPNIQNIRIDLKPSSNSVILTLISLYFFTINYNFKGLFVYNGMFFRFGETRNIIHNDDEVDTKLITDQLDKVIDAVLINACRSSKNNQRFTHHENEPLDLGFLVEAISFMLSIELDIEKLNSAFVKAHENETVEEVGSSNAARFYRSLNTIMEDSIKLQRHEGVSENVGDAVSNETKARFLKLITFALENNLNDLSNELPPFLKGILSMYDQFTSHRRTYEYSNVSEVMEHYGTLAIIRASFSNFYFRSGEEKSKSWLKDFSQDLKENREQYLKLILSVSDDFLMNFLFDGKYSSRSLPEWVSIFNLKAELMPHISSKMVVVIN